MATVLACYRLTRYWTHDPCCGLVAAACAAFDHRFIYFATEARPYALIQAVTLAQVFFFWRAAAQRSARDQWYATGAALILLHLHLTTSLLVLAEITYLALLRYVDPPETPVIRRDVATFLLLVAGSLPLLSLAAHVVHRRDNWSQFIPIPTVLELITVFPVVLHLLLPFGLMWGTCIVRRWQQPKSNRSAYGETGGAARDAQVSSDVWGWCLTWLALPLVSAWIVTRCDVARLFFPRYLMAASVATPHLAGLAVACQPNRRARSYLAMFMILSVLLVPYLRQGGLVPRRGQDWRGALKWVRTERESTAPVLLHSGLIETAEAESGTNGANSELLSYLRFPLQTQYDCGAEPALQIPLVPSPDGPLRSNDASRVASATAWWLVSNGGGDIVDAAIVQVDRRSPGWRIVERRKFGAIEVCHVARDQRVKQRAQRDADRLRESDRGADRR